MSHRASFFRISGWSTFLAAALLGAWVAWYLPGLLQLDEFRPDVVSLLEENCGCRVLMGNIRGELLPSPGLYVGHVVFLEPSEEPRVLASVAGVHLWLSGTSILHHQLQFRAIRFSKPRFIVSRVTGPSQTIHWVSLALPQATPVKTNSTIQSWDVRNGSLEIWDDTTEPELKYEIDQLTGSFQTLQQAGALTGRIPSLGAKSHINLRYQGGDPYPLQAELVGVVLSTLKRPFPFLAPWLEGSLGIVLKGRLLPDVVIHARLAPLLLTRLKGVRIEGETEYQNDTLHVQLQTVAVSSSPMTLVLEAHLPKAHRNLQATLHGFDAQVVNQLYENRWLQLLNSSGTAAIYVQANQTTNGWSWSAEGHDFKLLGRDLWLPHWTAAGEAQQLQVQALAQNPQGGIAQVQWNQKTGGADPTLDVAVSTLTVRQILELFNLQSSSASLASSATGTWNPYGYEPWTIQQGVMHAVIHTGKAFEVLQSSLSIAGMYLDLHGSFDLLPVHSLAHIQGSVQNVPLARVVESFFPPPSPVAGSALLQYTLSFPLSTLWLREMNGSLQLLAQNGYLKFFTTFYRIISVLNLGNYLRLRLPQMSVEGIVFRTVQGTFAFQNGVVSSEDLFLKSPNMNIGAKGAVDLPEKRLKITLRVELFRFLEDVLRDVPITHWIFKKPNKIFLPLVVTLVGPYNDIEAY